LRNIGATTAKWLESIGVNSLEDIEELGVVEVYLRLKTLYPEQVSLNALWALQGAVLDIPWNQLPNELKEKLKQELETASRS
jgi:DNA transformation protein